MSESTEPGDTPTGTDQIKADIEQTRAELSDTVDQVVDKLNPKTQLSEKAHSVRDTVTAQASRAKESATATHPGKIAAGVLGAVLTLVVVRRVRSGRHS